MAVAAVALEIRYYSSTPGSRRLSSGGIEIVVEVRADNAAVQAAASVVQRETFAGSLAAAAADRGLTLPAADLTVDVAGVTLSDFNVEACRSDQFIFEGKECKAKTNCPVEW